MSDEEQEPKPKKPRVAKAAESGDPAAPKPRARKAATPKTERIASGSGRSSVQAVTEDPAPRAETRRVLSVAIGVLLIDQLLKYYVIHILKLDRVREVDVFYPWLNLRMAWNQGVNFGLFASDVEVMRWVLVAVAVAVCVWVWIWLRNTVHSAFAQISAGLLIGGALGNVIDRMTYGAVADFLNMSLPSWQNPYSFNVADIAIFAGAVGLFLQPPLRRERSETAGEAETKPAAKTSAKAAAKSAGNSATAAGAKPVGKSTSSRSKADDKTRDGAGK
ncbi:signal peptidase II [Paracoccus aminophilus]|uniref:Lipoprotein signal peptidase n=1 Tax=Paracoccus aminophilus JCM 7686 TaxID=1367847 RepID=S5XS76_PARAH|nr:signal peptidase II [Paracoccus aminophilus]AGT10309.1 lipoprotein signal peptidase [Paracoccus aminophilus JCM 7686]